MSSEKLEHFTVEITANSEVLSTLKRVARNDD